MRVQFQSAGLFWVFFFFFFYCQTLFLRNKKHSGSSNHRLIQREKEIYKEHFEAKLNLIKYFLGTNITGQSWA